MSLRPRAAARTTSVIPPLLPSVAAFGVVLTLLAGCSTDRSAATSATSADRAAVRQTATRFLEAVGHGDAADACALVVDPQHTGPLAPGEKGFASCRAMVSGHDRSGSPVDHHRITDRLTFRPVLAKAPGQDASARLDTADQHPGTHPVTPRLQSRFRQLLCHPHQAGDAPRGTDRTPDPNRAVAVCSRDGSHKFLLAAAPVTGRGVAQVSVVPAAPGPSPTAGTSSPSARSAAVTGTAYDIELELNVHGRERFSQLTYHLAKTADGAGDRHLAYVLDSLVVSAPDVRSVNASGRTRLGVRVPEQRAEELAREVRAAHFMSPIARQGRATYARAGVREIGMTGADTAGAYLDLPAPLLATDPGITPPGILPLVRVHGQWLVDGLTAEWAVALVSACGRAPWRQGRSAESSRLSSSAAGAPLRSAFSPLSSPRPDPRRAASLLRPAR